MLGKWFNCDFCAANTPASTVYTDAPDAVATPMGQPVSGNVLDNANIPATTTAKVTGFGVAGSSQILAPGSSTTLSSPITGKAIGTLTLQASGAFNFLPVDGYAGAAPAVDVYSSCTNSATAAASLTIDVLLRKPRTAWQPPNCILGIIPLNMLGLDFIHSSGP